MSAARSKGAARRAGSRRARWLAPALGIALALVGAWAAYTYLSSEPEPHAEPEPAPAEVQPEPQVGFRRLEGPPPGDDTPHPGRLAAYARWIDAAGEALALAWIEELEIRPDLEPALAGADGHTALAVGARLYRLGAEGPRLVAERVEAQDPLRPGLSAGLYRDGLWPGDYDGDGIGEVIITYWMSMTKEPGPRRLVAAALSDSGAEAAAGTTRFDPPTGRRSPPGRLGPGAFAASGEALRAEAARLWDEAQFDLAEPPAHPAFYAHRRFDGASFQGTERHWRLVILPPYMVLSLDGDAELAVIRYDSISADEGGFVAEGKATVEGWEHGFRVSLAKAPARAPDGTEHPYSAVVDWSDGTRLSGWGGLAEDKSP